MSTTPPRGDRPALLDPAARLILVSAEVLNMDVITTTTPVVVDVEWVHGRARYCSPGLCATCANIHRRTIASACGQQAQLLFSGMVTLRYNGTSCLNGDSLSQMKWEGIISYLKEFTWCDESARTGTALEIQQTRSVDVLRHIVAIVLTTALSGHRHDELPPCSMTNQPAVNDYCQVADAGGLLLVWARWEQLSSAGAAKGSSLLFGLSACLGGLWRH